MSNNQQQQVESIEAHLSLNSTPSQVFRMVTSQNELRRWWAPRVIMSRNLVSQEQDRMIEMRLMQAEKYHLVRYSWRGQDWDARIDPTTITFRIRDLGASRSQTGEGLMLEISHDGWVDEEARNRQAGIWGRALPVLEALLSGKHAAPWWENESSRVSYQQVRLASLKPFVEKIGGEKPAPRNVLRAMWKICSSLDSEGTWYLKEGEQEFEYRSNGVRMFSINQPGEVSIFWEDLGRALGTNLDDFVRRLSVEQDMEISVESTEKIAAAAISAELWIRWWQDVVHTVEQAAQGSA